MGDRRRFDFSLIGFKPNLIIVSSDPHGSDMIRSSFKDEHSAGSIRLEYSESTRRQFSMTQEVIVSAAVEQAVMMKLPSQRVWSTDRAPSAVMLF